jgi:hypothetical protein
MRVVIHTRSTTKANDAHRFPSADRPLIIVWLIMARYLPYYLLKETRISTDSSIPGTTVVIGLPSHGTSLPSLRAAPKRPHVSDTPAAQDEASYSKHYLASSASIHFRRRKNPRSILWRVLEDGKTLSLQSLDLERSKSSGRRGENGATPILTLRLSFPHSIRPASVVFADAEGQPAFNIFVLTTTNVLYTLIIRDHFFQRSTTTEGNIGEWCKVFSPSAFTFRYPHRLVALDSNHLLISLHDGGLLRLKKRPTDDGENLYCPGEGRLLIKCRVVMGGILSQRWRVEVFNSGAPPMAGTQHNSIRECQPFIQYGYLDSTLSGPVSSLRRQSRSYYQGLESSEWTCRL